MTTRRGGRVALRTVDVVVPLAVLGALLQITRTHGGHTGSVVLAGAFVLVTQIVPGSVLWRFVRREHGSWTEDLALGGGLGIVVAGLLAAIGGYLHVAWLPLLLALSAIVALIVPASRRAWRSRPTTALPPPGWIAAVAATGVTFLWTYADVAAQNPVRWVGWMRHYIDQPYQLAVTAEVLHHGPQEFPWVDGTPLRYPWLFYGWVTSYAHLPGTALDVAVFRSAPVILLTLLPFAVAAAAWRLSGRVWVGPVGAVLAVTAGSLGIGVGGATTPIVLNSPPLQFGYVVLASTLCLLALRWRGAAARGSWLPLVVLLTGLLIAKGGPFPVVLGGMVLAAAVWLVLSRDRAQRVVLVDLALALLVFGVGFRWLLGGTASDLTPDPLAGLTRILTGDITTPLAASTLALATVSFAVLRLAPTAAALLLLDGDRRGDLIRWVLLGAPVAGLGAALLLYQTAMSQQYFLIAGVFVGSLGAAWGIGQTWDRERGRRLVLTGAAAGAAGWVSQYVLARSLDEPTAYAAIAQRWALLCAVTVIVAAAVLLVAGPRRPVGDLARALAVAVTVAALVSALPRLIDPQPLPIRPPVPGSTATWSADNVAAARFLKRVSSPSDVVMTNRHCNSLPLPTCDRRAWVISAYSQRRVLVEGWAYTPEAILAAAAATPPTSPFTGPFWNPELLELNDRFITTPNAADARVLWDRGVRWVYVDRIAGRSGDLAPYATRVFTNREATVYRLLDPRRPGAAT